jgi:methionyl-tRNA synthetase
MMLPRFIRTTEAQHKATCQELWRRCAASGDIYLDTYKGWYLEREETFVTPKDAEEWGFKDPQTGEPNEGPQTRGCALRGCTFWHRRNCVIFMFSLCLCVCVRARALLFLGGGCAAGSFRVRVLCLGVPLKEMEEQSYFFRLAKYAPRLKALYAATPAACLPDDRRAQIVSQLDELQDLSVSRTSFSWGIPVPEGFDQKHVMYARRWLLFSFFLRALGCK